MQNLTFFDYQNNKYGQNTLKTPKNIALHMKRKQIKPNERKTKANENVSQTCRKHFSNVSQTFNKHFATMSENNAKIVTPRRKMIYILFINTHAHTTTERL